MKRNDPYYQRNAPEPRQNHAKTYQYDSLNELEQDDYNDSKPYGVPSKPPVSPMTKAKTRVYEHQPEPEPAKLPPRPKRNYEYEKEFKLEESNIGTLDAESKKIPMDYGGGNKLSISSLENVNNTYNFGKPQAQSRAFRDETKESRGSRDSRRSNKDELDKLVDNKW